MSIPNLKQFRNLSWDKWNFGGGSTPSSNPPERPATAQDGIWRSARTRLMPLLQGSSPPREPRRQSFSSNNPYRNSSSPSPPSSGNPSQSSLSNENTFRRNTLYGDPLASSVPVHRPMSPLSQPQGRAQQAPPGPARTGRQASNDTTSTSGSTSSGRYSTPPTRLPSDVASPRPYSVYEPPSRRSIDPAVAPFGKFADRVDPFLPPQLLSNGPAPTPAPAPPVPTSPPSRRTSLFGAPPSVEYQITTPPRVPSPLAESPRLSIVSSLHEEQVVFAPNQTTHPLADPEPTPAPIVSPPSQLPLPALPVYVPASAMISPLALPSAIDPQPSAQSELISAPVPPLAPPVFHDDHHIDHNIWGSDASPTVDVKAQDIPKENTIVHVPEPSTQTARPEPPARVSSPFLETLPVESNHWAIHSDEPAHEASLTVESSEVSSLASLTPTPSAPATPANAEPPVQLTVDAIASEPSETSIVDDSNSEVQDAMDRFPEIDLDFTEISSPSRVASPSIERKPTNSSTFDLFDPLSQPAVHAQPATYTPAIPSRERDIYDPFADPELDSVSIESLPMAADMLRKTSTTSSNRTDLLIDDFSQPAMVTKQTIRPPEPEVVKPRTPQPVLPIDPVERWKVEYEEDIQTREAYSAAKREETRARAARSIDAFYDEYNLMKARRIRENKQREQEFVDSMRDSLAVGTTWDRICNIIELENSRSKTIARAGTGTTDLGRFRQALLTLKRDGRAGLAPGAAGY